MGGTEAGGGWRGLWVCLTQARRGTLYKGSGMALMVIMALWSVVLHGGEVFCVVPLQLRSVSYGYSCVVYMMLQSPII